MESFSDKIRIGEIRKQENGAVRVKIDEVEVSLAGLGTQTSSIFGYASTSS